jgi:hypothetical protein
MSNEPARNQQSNCKKNSANRQPVPPCPPQRKQKADAQSNANNLARYNVETTKYQDRTNEGGSQISSRERDGADSSCHVCNPALARVKGYRFDSSSCATCCNGVPEFMKGNNEHLLQRFGQRILIYSLV